MEIEQFLFVHCSVVAVVLGLVALLLHRKKLLGIGYAGSWIVAAAALYYVGNPLLALLNGDTALYHKYLRYTGGVTRMAWVLTVICVALVSFFFAYLLNNRGRPVSDYAPTKWRPARLGVLGALLGAACWSLLGTRIPFSDELRAGSEYDAMGHIVGGPTGYFLNCHHFLPVTVLLLFLSPKRALRTAGAIVSLIYVPLRLLDPWDRQSVVSFFLALAILLEHTGRRTAGVTQPVNGAGRRPARRMRGRKFLLLGVGCAIAIVLSARGHQSVIQWWSAAGQDRETVAGLSNSDTAMLPGLYLQTYISEIIGYDYGVHFITRAVTGPLPSKHFPWKTLLADEVLGHSRHARKRVFLDMLRGVKSTILGSFYDHGGLLGVALCMLVLGLLCRRLDSLARAGRTDLTRALGITWVSTAWMMYASSDLWCLMVAFIQAIPFLALRTYDVLQTMGAAQRLRIGKPSFTLQQMGPGR